MMLWCRLRLDSQGIQQVSLKLYLAAGALERLAINDENVFHSFPQGHDLGRMQIDFILGQDICHRIQQTISIIRRDG